MAKYKSTQSLQCWKQHRCAGCSALYRYLFKRQALATASSPERAQAQARQKLDTAINTTFDQQPCPQCGFYQPDMSAQYRRARYVGYGWCLWITLAVIACLSAADAVTIPGLTLTVLLVVGFCAAAEAWTSFRDHNGDLAKNRRLAETAMAKGIVRLDTPGAGNQPHLDAGWRKPGPAVYVLLLLGVLVLPAAEAVRRVRDWPLNEPFFPPVVGPGDKTTFYMPEKITSLKDYWRGQPSVQVMNADALGTSADQWPATAKENSWSGTISVKSSEKDSRSSPWISFIVPNENSLVGKVAALRLELKTEFPQMVGSSTYQTMKKDFVAESDLTLAPEGAGAQYLGCWYLGLVASALALAVAVWLLCRHARGEGRSTQTGILPLEQPAQSASPPPIPGVR